MAVDYNDNTVFPKNLIFYSDEEMKNAIYHTETGITINGFIAQGDENKTISHTIWWKWDFETGQTQIDKDKNDIADSYWIGKKISIPITVIGQQVNQNPTINQYAVTFDANGGILQGYGNSERMTKTLTYNEQYGELPIPTRNGYSFGGWVGKNILENIDTTPILKEKNCWGNWDGNRLILDSSAAGNSSNQMIKVQLWNDNSYIQPYTTRTTGNKKFTFTKDDTFNRLRLAINGDKQDVSLLIYLDNLQAGKTYTMSFKVDVYDFFHVEMIDIQIEEGSDASEFESFQLIVPTTLYTRSTNYKLTAKWIKE